jgi:septum formation protein
MLILASASPRRREILHQAGISFVVRPAHVDETPRAAEPPAEYVNRMARKKAMALSAEPGDIVLGADTTVVTGREMFAKPEDPADAARMLEQLSGRCHTGMTGVCLRAGAQIVEDRAETAVWFAPLSRAEIAEYVASGEPMDKAGAYAIQGLASKFVRRIEGCYFNVMGLPVSLVYQRLRELGQ